MNATALLSRIALAWALPLIARASLNNGDFSSGLDSWTAAGDVTVSAGAAVLGDDDATASTLYQPVNWPDASFTLEFDFQNNTSADVPQGTFPDTFFASIYFTSDPGSFTPTPGGFDSAIGLFDMDSVGTFNVNGTITPSGLGGTWMHYSGTFANPSAYVIPYFELQDFNFQNADSTVLIDNVTLVVPEPGTLALGACGMLALFARRRMRQPR